ncbi:uncharacterized protein LOC115559366 isoform X2 [Gadus morhua]|uniref:uncharacterized protein LOC115559366 isoform X2 n=1 Tax=Gadus morhua TaxID=8049 RepID=UPI0011B472CC|nr:uncharacterized protein LOC115559366 isoform X2 [Gadus morhua]
MLGTLCSLLAALTCVSAVTVVTQQPSVVTLTRGETASIDCNLGSVSDMMAFWHHKEVWLHCLQQVRRFLYGHEYKLNHCGIRRRHQGDRNWLQPPSSCPDSLPSFHQSALVQPCRSGLSGTADVYRLRRGELADQRESGHRRDLDQHRSSAPRQDFPTQQLSVPSRV